MDTHFLPARKEGLEKIRQQSELLSGIANLNKLYSAVTDAVMILNDARQIAYFNQNLKDMAGPDRQIAGMRPGEVFNCVHALESEGGCGTTRFCRECGAAKAILSSQKGVPALEECRIIQEDDSGALDLRIKTDQFRVNGQEFTIVAASDISHEKRRRVLERLFFHDIMNTAVGVRGLAELLSMAEEEQLAELRGMIHNGSEKLVQEINSQRMLAAAENNELALNITRISTLELLQEVYILYKLHEAAKEKTLVLDPESKDMVIKSDKAILFRVIGNMTKNALEASESGDKVTVGCRPEKGMAHFWVHNPAAMPVGVKLQIFQRSFSTKGQGRGLGTYSMKLFSEKYLKGKVSFSSSEEDGTTFSAFYPLEID